MDASFTINIGVIIMSIKLKKVLKEKLEPLLSEKGFQYDKLLSKSTSGDFVYSKWSTETELVWSSFLESWQPAKEEIYIYKSRSESKITIELRSVLKEDCQGLGYLAGYNIQMWWSIATKDEAEASFNEVIDLLNKYAWDWFTLID